ncbi:hypothetical protein HF086_013758, partial [Spodoptera exigua]
MLGRIYPLAVLLVFADVVMKASCTEKGSLTFVIDDNTSMRKDVDQIKNNLNEIKDIVFNGKSSVISNIVLVTFNNSVAHVKPVAGNRDDFEKALKEVYPSSTLSSVDCQELTIHALTTALKESNPGSYIFVFTDTFAKDFEDADIVKDLCQERQSQVQSVTIGLCQLTMKPMIMDVLTPISNIISGETIIITATTVPAGVSKNIPNINKYSNKMLQFDVDDQIEYVLVSVSGKTVTIDISGHNGRQENLMWNDNAKVNGKVKATGHVVKRFAKIPITTSKPPKLPDDKFLKVVIAEGNETSVEYNSSLTLTCKVSASPEPKIFWHNNKGRQMFSKVTKTNGSSSDYISYLNIHVTANDGYICHAINTAGTNKATIKVKVKDAFIVADTFLNVKVDYGKPGVLKCDIKSRFPTKTNWYLVNEISGEKDRIIDSDDYSLSADKTELTIKKMDFNLVGKYICHAYLINDRAIKTAISRRVKISGLDIPRILSRRSIIRQAVEGDDILKIPCVAVGDPRPTITWKMDGRPIEVP